MIRLLFLLAAAALLLLSLQVGNGNPAAERERERERGWQMNALQLLFFFSLGIASPPFSALFCGPRVEHLSHSEHGSDMGAHVNTQINSKPKPKTARRRRRLPVFFFFLFSYNERHRRRRRKKEARALAAGEAKQALSAFSVQRSHKRLLEGSVEGKN